MKYGQNLTFCSLVMALNNGQKNVFADLYDVTVRVIFDLLVRKCDHHFILLDISVKFRQILAYGQEHAFLRSWGNVRKSHQGIPEILHSGECNR